MWVLQQCCGASYYRRLTENVRLFDRTVATPKSLANAIPFSLALTSTQVSGHPEWTGLHLQTELLRTCYVCITYKIVLLLADLQPTCLQMFSMDSASQVLLLTEEYYVDRVNRPHLDLILTGQILFLCFSSSILEVQIFMQQSQNLDYTVVTSAR